MKNYENVIFIDFDTGDHIKAKTKKELSKHKAVEKGILVEDYFKIKTNSKNKLKEYQAEVKKQYKAVKTR